MLSSNAGQPMLDRWSRAGVLLVRSMEQNEILSEKILRPVAEAHTLCAFLALRGRRYRGELMVVGRAVNGWKEISPIEMSSPDRRRQFVNAAGSVQNDQCPMQWVLDSWAMKGVTTPHAPHSGASSRTSSIRARPKLNRLAIPLGLVQLVQGAPSEGGNPSGSLQQVQFEGCKALLKLEIESFMPARLLFLTGWAWAAPFLAESDRLPHPTRHPRSGDGPLGPWANANLAWWSPAIRRASRIENGCTRYSPPSGNARSGSLKERGTSAMPKLLDEMERYLGHWQDDLPSAWRTRLDSVAPKLDAIPRDASLDLDARIVPVRRNRGRVFYALEGIDPSDVNAVMLGNDPYSDPIRATGRSFEQGDLTEWTDDLSEPGRVTRSLLSLVCAAARCTRMRRRLGWTVAVSAIVEKSSFAGSKRAKSCSHPHAPCLRI